MSTTHSERMDRFKTAGLYVVTSEALSNARSTLAIVEATLKGGCRLIQLREKALSLPRLVALAREVRSLTWRYNALLIINDRVDVALSVEADGVHLGLDDLPVECARRIAPELIIGASSHTFDEALHAETAGASYVNIGPVYPTQTKAWSKNFLGLEGVRRIAPALSTPFTLMGGLKREHFRSLAATGAAALAVVTAVTAVEDPETAVRDMLAELRAAGMKTPV